MSGLVPKLRFKQDDGLDFPEWEEKTFEQAVKRRTGDEDRHTRLHNWVIDLEHLESGTGRILSKASAEYSLSQKNIFASGDILFGKLRPYLKKYGRPDFDGVCSSEIWVLSGITVLNSYLFYVVQSSYFNQLANISSGSKMPRSDWSTIADSEFFFPSLPEQQKIADFLSAMDAKIDAVKRKRDAFERYKKGLMQQIFSQKIEFKQDNGSDFPDWEEKRLGDVFKRVTRKNSENCQNVLTISAQRGLINQEKYFSKSVSAKDITNYYLLKNGEFAYNKSYSNGFPMGAIKRLNNYPKGVVSTLYICFSTKDAASSAYFEKFFDSGSINRELAKIAQEGARNHGLLNIGVVDFFELIYFLVPSLPEQQKIADFLSAIDAKIDAVTSQVQKLEAFKKGLLQQMFV